MVKFDIYYCIYTKLATSLVVHVKHDFWCDNFFAQFREPKQRSDIWNFKWKFNGKKAR